MFATAFVGNMILARCLGASGMGIWSIMVTFLSMILLVCGPGIASANVYYVAQGKHTAGESWAVTLLLGTGFGIVGVCTGKVLLWLRFKSIAGIEDQRLILLLLLSLPLLYITDWGYKIILGMDRIGLMNLLGLISNIFHLGLIILFVEIMKIGLWGVVTAYLGMYLSSTLMLIVTFLILMRPKEFRLRWKTIQLDVVYGVKIYFGKLSEWTNNRIDLLIAPLFLDSKQIGLYAVVVAVTEKLWLIPSAISQAVFPKISADIKGRPELVGRACRTSIIIMLPIMLLLIAGGWWVIPALFGSEFQGSYLPMLAILPGIFMLGISQILSASLAATNHPATISAVVTVASVINVILNFLLIPRMGITGCSLASTGSYTFQAVALLWYYCQYTGVRPVSLIRVQFSDLLILLKQSRQIIANGSYERQESLRFKLFNKICSR
ncbi:MAG: polysaccharide biosynthesis C-terminal domain-containing protein [bacterium]